MAHVILKPLKVILHLEVECTCEVGGTQGRRGEGIVHTCIGRYGTRTVNVVVQYHEHYLGLKSKQNQTSLQARARVDREKRVCISIGVVGGLTGLALAESIF